MSLPLSGLSLAALAVTPFIGRQIEDGIVKSRYSIVPKDAELYPPFYKWFRGAETNTTPGGVMVFGIATVLGFAALRKGVFGPIHRRLAQQWLCYPGTTKQIPITSFKQFVHSLGPAVISTSLNLSAALVIGYTAKGYSEGPGRFANWGPRPYDARLKQVLTPKITHYTSGDHSNHH